MSIFQWLFGKKPKIIFTKDGKARHELEDYKWTAWKNRFEQSPDYNWRSHTGTKGTPKK